MADAAPCIVRSNSDGTIVVDIDHPSYPRPKAPGLIRRAGNFAVSSAQHVVAGAPACTPEQVEARHAICMGCEFYDGELCVKCGCPVVREKNYLSKLSWADQSCPIGKW